ncbi:MAG: signal recognition particle protein, partial [Nitrospirales bacterium]|nr:signal recognition particle protein [Nitrospirales bacterium]
DVDLALKEIRLALLEADVNFKVVKDFVQHIKDRAVGKDVLESLSPGQQVVKIVHEELCNLLGTTSHRIQLAPNPPTIIMMVGLQGSGKTTTSAKLARLFRKEGRRPMMAAADLQRPAAIDQLITLGKQLDIPVYHSRETKDPVSVCEGAVKQARLESRDVVILDTAGRLHVDSELMDQLKRIKDAVNPKEVLLGADAMTGQDAVTMAKSFSEQVGLDGVILTKMDGDARGGAALSIRQVTGVPIKFIGAGEKIDMLEPFYPDRIASRILGMGDVLTLIEQAQQSFDQKEAEKLHKRIMEDSFSFEDLRDQLKKIRNMGPLENILKMIPGMGKALKDVKVDEKEFVKIEAIINSMTGKERNDHNLLNGSRRKRIAMGSGTTVADVNRLVKQYLEMKKMMKMFKGMGKKGFRLPKMPPF